MLKNLLNDFKKSYDKYGEGFICDQHKLDEGLYIKVFSDGSIESHIFKKAKDQNVVSDTYQWFQKRDFISKYLESNKAIPTKPPKKIHSNNYLSWFVKKDTFLESEKVMNKDEIIEMTKSYFEYFESDQLNSDAVIEALESDFSKEAYGFCRNFMINNYHSIEAIIVDKKDEFKNYVKVFFDLNFSLYERESKRYFFHKIFNKNDYNVEINNELYGLSNFNMGLNAKKPYLEHKTTSFKVPYRISLEEAFLGYKYSLYLKNLGYGSFYQVSDEPVPSQLYKIIKEKDETQNFIQLGQDNGNVIIEDYDIIPTYCEKLMYRTLNVLKYKYKSEKNKDIYIEKSYEHPKPFTKICLEDDIDQYLFRGQLKRQYFTDAKSLKVNQYMNRTILEALISSRQMLFDFFKKSISENLAIFINRYGLTLVRNSLNEGNVKGIDAFNTYYSIKMYCKGESDVNAIITYKEKLKKLLESDCDDSFDSDELYSFAAGQLSYFLLSKSASSKKNHDVIEPFLNRKYVGQLNDEITYWFKRYAHDIGMYQKKFNKLYAMVLGHDKKATKQDDMFLAGYLSNNILYEKKEI